MWGYPREHRCKRNAADNAEYCTCGSKNDDGAEKTNVSSLAETYGSAKDNSRDHRSRYPRCKTLNDALELHGGVAIRQLAQHRLRIEPALQN